MRWCIYAAFCIMLFLFSGSYIKPRDLPGKNFAWNHFKQQLNFSCWTITCPSFILLGKWKGNHFLCRTGALLCFSWCWIYIRSWSSMNLWLLNNNSSSVRHQQGHEREMTHRHTHIQKKIKKREKDLCWIPASIYTLWSNLSASWLFIWAGFCGITVWQKCMGCFAYALLLPAHALLSEGGLNVATPVLS